MPLYLVMSEPGTVPHEEKEAVAMAFTDIHRSLTFAPASFVHVYFLEQPMGEAPMKCFISGNIRADRSDAVKEQIMERMRSTLAQTVGCSIDEVQMSISDSPANWTMEGGHLLPAAGEEDAWLERHEAMINAMAADSRAG